ETNPVLEELPDEPGPDSQDEGESSGDDNFENELSLAEPGCAAQAAAFGGRASSAGVGARGPAVRQGSAREAVGSAFLVRAYAEFTAVADLEQADQRRTIWDSNRISRR